MTIFYSNFNIKHKYIQIIKIKNTDTCCACIPASIYNLFDTY